MENEIDNIVNNKKKKTVLREIVEWSVCIVVAIILALIVRYYIGTPTIVQHPSMTPTLISGERLLLNRLHVALGNEINRGDIITFEAPSKNYITTYQANETSNYAEYNHNIEGVFNKVAYDILEITKTSYIKRVIGVEGDQIKIADGNVYLNGKLLEESYLPEGTNTTPENGVFTDLVVPEGAVFVMGDNRDDSTDSRAFGCVPMDKIESKVAIRFWPLDKFGEVK